ncbi:hypothetical protein [Anaerovibrio lipolyticus]|uniref:hypothetical protein n=1 Tax=Anaerovibrio lipolyticus TaxID=82374 RepID=UPI00047F2D44|nr:hypothetical protein [Anaerovibrio lipolyticus]
MKRNTKALLCAGLMAVSLVLPQVADASKYNASTDTNADVLDYLENNKRSARENAITDEQKQLVHDAFEMRKNLRDPLDPTKNVPVAMEGDELFYDQRNGDFYAIGQVNITFLDAQRFQTEEVNGNIQNTEVNVPGKGHMVQMTPGQAKIVMDGYKIQYNYGKKIGSMEDASGKIDHEYIKGKRIEMYPDKIIVYDGTMTKCSAINPDYHTSASKIEVYPGDKMICYDLKFWLGHVPVYSTKKRTFRLDQEDDQTDLPKVGYTNDDGWWISKDFRYNLAKRLYIDSEVKYTGKHGFRSHADLVYATRLGTFKVLYGYFESSNNKWVKKEPSFTYEKSIPLGDLPLSLGLNYERGRWNQNNIHSMHTYYGISLSHNTINLGGNHRLDLSTSYSITNESTNRSSVRGFGYTALLRRDVDDRWSYYARWSYSQANTKNSLFDYDLDSYSRKFATGFSYKFSDHDRVLVGSAFDVNDRSLADMDLYWFHEFHCLQLISRYRVKRHQVNFTLQFNPW